MPCPNVMLGTVRTSHRGRIGASVFKDAASPATHTVAERLIEPRSFAGHGMPCPY